MCVCVHVRVCVVLCHVSCSISGSSFILDLLVSLIMLSIAVMYSFTREMYCIVRPHLIGRALAGLTGRPTAMGKI